MRLRSTLTALTLLTFAVPVLAQQGPTTGFDAPRPAPVPTPAPAPEPEPTPVPTAAPRAAPEGPENIRESYGDWQLRCYGESDDCFILQIARNAQGGAAAEFSLIKLPTGQQAEAGVTVTVPLGVLLKERLLLQVDSAEPVAYEFDFCIDAGCLSRLGLTAPEVLGMKRGNEAKLILNAVGVEDNPVVLTISLTGFTAAYEALP